MDAKEFLMICTKECKKHAYCSSCPLHKHLCDPWHEGYSKITDQDIDNVLQTVNELAHKTYAVAFFEKFPNAIKKADGEPRTCRDLVYGTKYAYCGADHCSNCWNEPYINQNEEEERQ